MALLNLSIETVARPVPGRTGGDEALRWTVVRVGGDLDAATGPQLRRRLTDLVDEGVRHLVLDLGDLEFLDSSGVAVLVACLERLRIAGGALRLAACRPAVRSVLTITSLDRVLALYPSVETALVDVVGPPPPTPA